VRETSKRDRKRTRWRMHMHRHEIPKMHEDCSLQRCSHSYIRLAPLFTDGLAHSCVRLQLLIYEHKTHLSAVTSAACCHLRHHPICPLSNVLLPHAGRHAPTRAHQGASGVSAVLGSAEKTPPCQPSENTTPSFSSISFACVAT